MKLPFTCAIAMLACAAVSCGKSEGPGLDVPAIEPPVRANLPSSMTGGLKLADCGPPPVAGSSTDAAWQTYFNCAVIAEVRSRFFSVGPTQLVGPGSILAKADESMQQIATQADGKEVACMTETPIEMASSYKYTDKDGSEKTMDFAFPTHLNCRTEMTSDGRSAYRAFGKKDDTFYMREGNFGMANMVYSVTAEEKAELWFQLGNDATMASMSTGVVHIFSDPANKITEITHTGTGLGYGCGIQLRTNQDLLYFKVKVARPDNPENNCAENYAAATNSSATGIYKDLVLCASATDFSVKDTAACKAAGLDKFKLAALSYESISVTGAARIMKDAVNPAIPAFKAVAAD